MNIGLKALATLVASVFLSVGPATAQTSGEDKPLTADVIRLLTPGVRQALAKPRSEHVIGPQWKPSPPPQNPRTARKVAGGILGGIGGFLAGGLIGMAVAPDCHCGDQEAAGAMVGAPIGAAIGAIAGVILASR